LFHLCRLSLWYMACVCALMSGLASECNRHPAVLQLRHILQGTVPEAIISFLDSSSYEDAIRNAISLGGDSDTLACITGGIAEAFYGPVPEPIQAAVRKILPSDLLNITSKFYAKFINH